MTWESIVFGGGRRGGGGGGVKMDSHVSIHSFTHSFIQSCLAFLQCGAVLHTHAHNKPAHCIPLLLSLLLPYYCFYYCYMCDTTHLRSPCLVNYLVSYRTKESMTSEHRGITNKHAQPGPGTRRVALCSERKVVGHNIHIRQVVPPIPFLPACVPNVPATTRCLPQRVLVCVGFFWESELPHHQEEH